MEDPEGGGNLGFGPLVSGRPGGVTDPRGPTHPGGARGRPPQGSGLRNTWDFLGYDVGAMGCWYTCVTVWAPLLSLYICLSKSNIPIMSTGAV